MILVQKRLLGLRRRTARDSRTLSEAQGILKEVEAISKYVLVDCRSDKEREISMVKGAVSKETFEVMDLDPAIAETHVAVYAR